MTEKSVRIQRIQNQFQFLVILLKNDFWKNEFYFRYNLEQVYKKLIFCHKTVFVAKSSSASWTSGWIVK